MAGQAQPVRAAWRAFFTEELWPASEPGRRAGPRDWGRFVRVVAVGFVQNRCWVRAAALTYTTLLALVPLLAVVLSVTTALLKTNEDAVFDHLMQAVSNVAPQLRQAPPEQQERMRATFQRSLAAVSAGKLGLFGTFMLIVTSVSLFSTIERTLNDIWGIRRGRSPLLKVVFYWSTLTLGSIVLFLAVGSTSLLKAPAFLERWRLDFLSPLLHLIPFVVLWGGFAALYGLMPNTRVSLRAALLGGIVAGTLWQLNNYLNVLYVAKIVSAHKLYGSLGLVPVFMLGLYVSWLFVLLGAQVAYTLHNAPVLAREKDEESENPNSRCRELIALRIMLAIARQFLRAEPPLTTTDISHRIGVPLNVVNRSAQLLCSAGLLYEIAGKQAAYEPARPLEKITALDVLRALREHDGKLQQTTDDEDDRLVRSLAGQVEAAIEGSARRFDFRTLAGVGEPGRG